MLLLVLLAVLLVSVACTGPQPEPSTSAAPPVDPSLHIGVLLPLTGELASGGEQSLRGMQLAAEKINEGGGIATLGGARIQLIQGDTQGDPGVAVSELERLVEEEQVVAVIHGLQSTVALPVTAAAEPLQVPVVVAFAAADEITERGLTYTFRLCPKADWYGRDQVRFLVALPSLGGPAVTKVALLHEDGPFGRGTAAGQREHLDRVAIEVVDEVTYPAGQAELSREVLRLKGAEAQAVLTATYPSDALIIASTAHVVRLQLPIIDAGAGFLYGGFISGLGESAEGLLTVTEYWSGGGAQEVERAFRRAFAAEPDSASLYSYQAVLVLADALARSASTDRTALRSALAATSLEAGDDMVLPQTRLSFDGAGQNRTARLLVAQVQDRRWVPVWPAELAEAEVRLP